MGNIDPVANIAGAPQLQLPQEAAMKQVFGLAFKEILNSLSTEDDEIRNAFKTEEDQDVEATSGKLSGIATNLSGYPEQFADSFINSPKGQQLLNQFYRQYATSVEINNQVE